MAYLIASFILINCFHGWLLLSHHPENPASLSYHSVRNRFTLIAYQLTHLLAGILFLLLVETSFDSPELLALALVIATAEWLQAFVPARGKTELLHTILATIMAVGLIIFWLLATLLFAPNELVKGVNIIIFLILVGFASQVRYPPKKNFWKIQYIGQTLVYLQAFLLV